MIHEDTIAAIATPVGHAGLAIVRVSGQQALAVADACFEPVGVSSVKPSEAASHTIHFGRVVHQGRRIDEVLVSVMRAPRTFTREDTVEITCHGGFLPAKLVLDAALASGARVAQPGEFTRRAFLNGRIDLTQAEAVADIIHSRTELALQAAEEQLSGTLSRQIETVREDLLNALAHLEAHIDFPDEDIAPDSREGIVLRLEKGIEIIRGLLRTASDGRILREGIRSAIVGRPNAGKSSLMNVLLGHDRAIVSSVPGTTRDTIEETASIMGIPVVFIDTAGMRSARDAIEEEGIRRTRQALARAELVLHVVDFSEPFTASDAGLFAEYSRGKKSLLVMNKADLPQRCELPDQMRSSEVRVSCITGEGVEALKAAIRNLVWTGQAGSAAPRPMINSRHQDALSRAEAAAARTLGALRDDLSLELVAAELRIALGALGEVTGQITTEDLLDRIFSQFCIGK